MRLRSIFDTKWHQKARLVIFGYLLCSTHGLNNNSEFMFVGAPHRHYKASRIPFRKSTTSANLILFLWLLVLGVVRYDCTTMILHRRKSHGIGYTNQRHTQLIMLQVCSRYSWVSYLCVSLCTEYICLPLLLQGCFGSCKAYPPCSSSLDRFKLVYQSKGCLVPFLGAAYPYGVPYCTAVLKFGANKRFKGADFDRTWIESHIPFQKV